MADRQLLLELGSFQEVLDRCASRVSEEGMFFETTEAGAVGSEVAFEVRIRDSFSVLRGDGEIVRATGEGVFVRLSYLDQPSLKLLPKIVEHFRRLGVPPLELPEVEIVETQEEEEEPLAAEPTADDLWPKEKASAPESSVGLTLDDLEAEFLTRKDTDKIEEQASVEPDVEPEAMLVDAMEFATSIGIKSEVESEPEVEVEPLLVDPGDLIADTPENQEAFAPDDIHLNEFLTAEEAAGREPATDLERKLPVDPGLPWLPDEEPAKRSRKDLWLILVLIALGAALGVAFYFFFLRPGDASSQESAEPPEVRASVVPAAVPIVDPTPITVETGQPQPAGQAEEVAQGELSTAPSSVPSADLLTGVDQITWVLEAGETVVTFWADGPFTAEQVDDFRVAGEPPREVVRIRGVRRPFPQKEIELDTAHVRRIRVGLHQDSEGVALHFVADLVDSDVEILRTEAAGEQLRVYFAKAG